MKFFAFLKSHVFLVVISLVAVLSVAGTVFFVTRTVPLAVSGLHLNDNAVHFTSFTQTHQLSAVTEPSGIPAEDLLWSSSDGGVVEVGASGLLTPKGNGRAVITVCGKAGNGIDHCIVSVDAVSSLVFNSHDVVLAPGQIQQLLVLSDPGSADPASFLWSSSAPGVVSVDEEGRISALLAGEAEITVASPDGTVSDMCRVTVVRDVPLEGLAFAVSEFTFRTPEDTLTLTPQFTPVDTSRRELLWYSTDESVVTVDEQTGKVTPLSNGTATVTAKSYYGELEAACVITVDLSVPLKGVSLSRDSYTFSDYGQNYLIAPVFDPVNASNKTIVWTSSDPEVATVSPTGVVTSVKNGTAKITLKTEDGGYGASFAVIVAKSLTVDVTGLVLNTHALSLTGVGSTGVIVASVLPENATDKKVTYTSSNPSVATVSAAGKVVAAGYGTAQISVRSNNGAFSENVTVTVAAPAVEQPITAEKAYVRGVWVATVSNLDFPSRPGLTADQLKVEINVILDNVVRWGLNTVYLQVRPAADALYRSELFPSSLAVVEQQGDELPLDILDYFVSEAHARGISLHAWINPYRVTVASKTTEALARTSPAVQHPEWLCTDGARLYFNPGLPEVRKLVIDGVMEIVKKYDVDGVHFDDYFYPDDLAKWDDSAAFAAYGNGLSLADWRRSNNDLLIRGVYDAIKNYDSSLEFGVSPAAVWALESWEKGGVPVQAAYQTYSDCFADTKKWVENGWLDYICPQVYMQIDHSTAPFMPIVKWWNDLTAKTKVSLYVGIAAYRCKTSPSYQTGTEIDAELNYLDTMKNVSGAVFFSYESLVNNYAGVGDAVRNRYYAEPLSTELKFTNKSMTLDSSYKSTYIVGLSDPNFPLYADGVPVERNELGYFAYYVQLTGTKTTVRFRHKDKTVDYVITRVSSGSTGSSYLPSFGFAAGSFTPSYDVADRSGTKVTFSCVAPAGAKVTVRIGSYTVDLTTKTAKPNNGKYLKATYSGTLTLPQIDENANASLGYAVFSAQMGDESAEYSPGCQIEVINDPSSYGMEVTRDRSDIRPNLEVDPDLFYIATAGTKVHVVSKADGNAKLTNGMYMGISDLSRLKTPFGSGEVRGAAVNLSKKYTVLSLHLTERTLHTVWMGEEAAEVTLYHLKNTDLTLPALPANPLFSSMNAEKIDDTTLRITLTYHKSLHIYGYYCNFDGTTLYVNFRNPAAFGSGSRPLEGIVISLDPGHSQSEGAVATFNGITRTEAEWNMQLSLLVEERLKALGATVVLTHRGEQTYSLDELIPQYRALSPDVNVSIHFNAVPKDANPLKVKGTVTYWCYGNSHLLSDIMLDEFVAVTGLRRNRSVCGYYKVSRLCEFPSILFETAFISNPDDFAYFLKEEGMNAAAEGITNGIVAFFREQNAS